MGLINIDGEDFEYDDSYTNKELVIAAQIREPRHFDADIHGTLEWSPEPRQCTLISNDRIVNSPIRFPIDASVQDLKNIDSQYWDNEQTVCVKRPMECTNIFVFRIWFRGQVWTEYLMSRGRSAFSSQFCSNYWKKICPVLASMNFGQLFQTRLSQVFAAEFSNGFDEYLKILSTLTLQDFGIQEDPNVPYAYIDAWAFSRFGFESSRKEQPCENVQYLYSISPQGNLMRWPNDDEFFKRWPKYSWSEMMMDLQADDHLSTWLIICTNNSDSNVKKLNSIAVMSDPTKRISDALDGGPCALYKMYKYIMACNDVETQIGRYSRFPETKIISKEEAMNNLEALNIWMPHDSLIWTILCLFAFKKYPAEQFALDPHKIRFIFEDWRRLRPRRGDLLSQCTALAAQICGHVLESVGIDVDQWINFARSTRQLRLDQRCVFDNQVANIILALKTRAFDQDYEVATKMFAL